MCLININAHNSSGKFPPAHGMFAPSLARGAAGGPGIHILSVCVKSSCSTVSWTVFIDSAVGKPSVPQPSSTSFLFSFSLFFALLHLVRLLVFHALSSYDTVGGAERYLEFLRAASLRFYPLLCCRKVSLTSANKWEKDTLLHQ